MEDITQARVTYAQAAAVLEVGASAIAKMIRRGDLTSVSGRGQGPSLLRADVERLAVKRAEAAREKRKARTLRAAPRAGAPPESVDGHGWLTPRQAGAIIGLTEQGIRKRCRKGKIPHAHAGQRYWIREDHARLVAHVHATDGPEAVAIALDGIT